MKTKAIIILVILLSIATLFTACSSDEEIVDYYTPGEYIVTNVAESYRLLKAAPVLVVNRNVTDDTDFQEELAAITPAIRDAINIVLRVRTEDEVRSAGIMDELRVEIVSTLQQKLGMDYVTYVYFSDFVVQ